MASIATVLRLSARAATQQLRSHGARRALHSGQASLAAQNFNMPALSPTMTEGNIATWKIKEGDSFSAGDVLLEIETDKAQMDVEAQDDGVLAKILIGDGSKAVQVGTRIAVTAETGDDLSSLELPKEDSSAPKKAESSKDQTKETPSKESQAVPKDETTSSAPQSNTPKKSPGGKARQQTYPLYPSVQYLLETNGLAKAEADKIPATGPNGRLLKGDVLAYIGKIDGSYPSELADRFTKLAHLDLSNIKPAPRKEAVQKQATEQASSTVEEANVDVTLWVAMSNLHAYKNVNSLGASIPVDTFVHRATEIANEKLPKTRDTKPSADVLFNAVLGLRTVPEKKFSRGHFVPNWSRSFPHRDAFRWKEQRPLDVLDVLAGKRSPRQKSTDPGHILPFRLTVPKSEEERARVFLERVKELLETEPARLAVREYAGRE